MKSILLTILLALGLAASSHAGTRGIVYIHQPLSTLGTESDGAVIIARFPALTNGFPQLLYALIAAPNRLVQDPDTGVPNSNILSALNIPITAEELKENHYRVTIDLQKAGDPDDHGVTLDDVLAGTIQCLQKTCTENKLGSFEIKILAAPGDKTNWSKYEKKFSAPKKK